MTKRNIFNFILLNCLFFSLVSCGQASLPYVVDSTIGKIVDENIKSTMTQTLNAIKSVETTNDSIILENFGLGKNLDAITEAYLSNDTIFIISALAARDATFGYKIILTRQNCIVNYFSVADENIFKINKNDKVGGEISFECSINKLTLTQKSKFEIGESIEGVLELTTNDYWIVNNETETKIKKKLTGYFKTKLKNANERHLNY
jgi:hypothetical protein